MEDLNDLMNSLSIENTSDYESILETLASQGIQNPSKSLMNKLMSKMNAKRCCSCHYIGDSVDDLARHVRKEEHLYGQGKFARFKRQMISRVKKNHPLENAHLPEVSESSEDPLSDNEKIAFASLSTNQSMSEEERGSYQGLLYVGFCLVYLRRKGRGSRRSE